MACSNDFTGALMVRHGVVIGKFYPPHRGHVHLIETGQAQSERLTVILCKREGEHPPGHLRREWLQELFPSVNIRLVEDHYDPHDSALWAQLTREWLGESPDAVFTSEVYGEAYARHLGCRHVAVDPARQAVPISGTRIRSNPWAAWDYLPAPVRGYYAKRVVLIGAESTGKTTLAAALADKLQTIWVPEFGRDYAEKKFEQHALSQWTSVEFETIARTQCEWENAAARHANRVLVCDTDAFATSSWHERYMGWPSPQVEAIAERHRRPDLYLLTDIRTPFVQDGTRDGESIRHDMHRRIRERLIETGRQFIEVSGSPGERLAFAADAVRGLMQPVQ
jgi:HTH-type transcriptional repressor of NAD biosynthesis genes